MNLTIDEELRLKRIIRSGEKEVLLLELSREIERKERAMVESISSDYLNIIKKCTDLEKIKQILPRIMCLNEELAESIRDSSMQHINVVEEIDENVRIKSRLDCVVSELREILRFIDTARVSSDVGDEGKDLLDYYTLARNVVFMREKLCCFQNYVFFTDMNQIYVRMKERLIGLMERDVDMWIREVCNDVMNVGNEVVKGMRECDGKTGYVFDFLGGLRRRVISRRCLGVIYSARKIGVEGTIVDRINAKRKEFIEGICRSDDPTTVCIIIGYVLWSYYLIELDTGFKTHNRSMFNVLSQNEMLFKIKNFRRLREGLIVLRMLVVRLNFDFEDVDRIVSSVAVSYFEANGPRECDIDGSDLERAKSSMVVFIDECNGFVSNISQFSNELDELLAKKIDSHLCALLERNKDDMEIFIEVQDVIRYVLDYAIKKNSFYRGVEFKCVEEVERLNDCSVKEIFDSSRLKIDALFGDVTSSGDFGVDLLGLFCKVNSLRLPSSGLNIEMKKKLVCYVRDKFMDVLRDKEASVAERKMVMGHACSFYGHLRKSEPAMSDLFGPVIELCKD